jgi:polyhydroxyalkanoate synthase subunit PhaC
MPRLKLQIDAVNKEIAEFQDRVRRGVGVLRQIGEVRIGATPRSVIFELEGVRLYRYGSAQRGAGGTPLLIVYALVNRPEVADLQADRSLIAALLARGFDVYLIDWGYPGGADRMLGLDDYVTRYIDACVEHLLARLQRASLSLLGICQGGTLSVCYAALYPRKVERLITTVTPIDFHTDEDMLSHLVRRVDIARLLESCGNVSGDVLNSLFLSLKPYRLTQQKYLRFLEQLDDAAAVAMFLRMEQWIFDSPALAARACGEFVRDFYQGNKLLKGELQLAGRAIDLRVVDMPVLNIYARDDHLVPPAAARALGALIGTKNYTELELAGGHIGIYVGLKSPGSVPVAVAEWMAKLG